MASSERFGYEWEKFSSIIPEYEEQFLKWAYPLSKKDFIGKSVLDGGCGIGRNSYWPLLYGAKKLLAFDFDRRTVAVAKKNLKQFKHARVEYQSIYEINYKNQFDISFSIGVIHHLENPRLAVKNLVIATKKNGKILIWVYGKQGGGLFVNMINTIRALASKLPIQLTHYWAYFFSVPLFVFIKLIPQSHPYLKQLKGFRFWHIHSIVFDQMLPTVAHYWSKDEAEELFNNLPVKNIKTYSVNDISWTVVATKK